MAWKTLVLEMFMSDNIFVLIFSFLIIYSCHAIYIKLAINCSKDATFM